MLLSILNYVYKNIDLSEAVANSCLQSYSEIISVI